MSLEKSLGKTELAEVVKLAFSGDKFLPTTERSRELREKFKDAGSYANDEFNNLMHHLYDPKDGHERKLQGIINKYLEAYVSIIKQCKQLCYSVEIMNVFDLR